MISNGFTDDLFPADEAIRYYNRTHSQYPNAPVSMFFGDFGHMRAVGKAAESAALDAAQNAWLDFYVKGAGSEPFQGVTAYAITCPTSAPSGGPFQASTWANFEHGVVRLQDAGSKTISANGGSPTVDTSFDPVGGGGACASPSANDLPGVATYRLPAAAGNGYTLMGSPTVVATIDSPVANSELAARLLDVDARWHRDPGRSPALPASGREGAPGLPAASERHLFAPGHVAKLELLPRDAGGGTLNSYGRAANGQGDITVSGLDLRLPVLEGPGAAGGQVTAAPALPLPCGMAIAPQFSSDSYLRASIGQGKVQVKGRTAQVPIDSAPGSNPCQVQVALLGPGKGTSGRSAKKHQKKGKKKGKKVLGRGSATIPGGQSATVKLTLSKHGPSTVARGRGISLQVTTVDSAGNTVQTATVNFNKKKKKHGKHKKH